MLDLVSDPLDSEVQTQTDATTGQIHLQFFNQFVADDPIIGNDKSKKNYFSCLYRNDPIGLW
jgi:hypothetical protein